MHGSFFQVWVKFTHSTNDENNSNQTERQVIYYRYCAANASSLCCFVSLRILQIYKLNKYTTKTNQIHKRRARVVRVNPPEVSATINNSLYWCRKPGQTCVLTITYEDDWIYTCDPDLNLVVILFSFDTVYKIHMIPFFFYLLQEYCIFFPVYTRYTYVHASGIF